MNEGTIPPKALNSERDSIVTGAQTRNSDQSTRAKAAVTAVGLQRGGGSRSRQSRVVMWLLETSASEDVVSDGGAGRQCDVEGGGTLVGGVDQVGGVVDLIAVADREDGDG